MDNKQKFIDYCKDKIKDLGETEYIDPVLEEPITADVIMISDIRQFKDLKVITDDDDYGEALRAVDDKGNLVINTPMSDCFQIAASLQFSTIDTQFYNGLIDLWDETFMDEYMEQEDEESITEDYQPAFQVDTKTTDLNIDKNTFLSKLSSFVKDNYTFNEELYNEYGDIEMTNKEDKNYNIYLYRDNKTNKVHLSLGAIGMSDFIENEDKIPAIINLDILSEAIYDWYQTYTFNGYTGYLQDLLQSFRENPQSYKKDLQRLITDEDSLAFMERNNFKDKAVNKVNKLINAIDELSTME